MWYVFAKTGSGLATGMILVLSFIPQVVAGPFLGVVADRSNRKRLMLLSSLLQAVLAFVLMGLIAWQRANLTELFGITLLMSVAGLVYEPARSGVFPDIVPAEELLAANGLFSTSRQIARLVGSTIGGMLVAIVGVAWAIGFDAVSFVASAAFIAAMGRLHVRRKNTDEESATLIQDLKTGWRWLLSRRGLMVIIGIGTVSNIALGPTNVLPPMLITSVLHANAAALGVFDASIGLGILIGGLVIGTLPTTRVGIVFSVGIGLEAVGMTIVAVAPWLWVAYIGNFILGFAVITASLPMSTLFQLLIPDAMRGRINSITSMLFTVSIPVTYGGIGVVGDLIGARWSYGFGALLLGASALASLMVSLSRTLGYGIEPETQGGELSP